MNSDVTKLIIIGNGFDLTCGVKSSFKDFINSKWDLDQERDFIDVIHSFKTFSEQDVAKLISNPNSSIESSAKYKETTPFNFWMYVLLSAVQGPADLKNSSWADIESKLRDFLFEGVRVPQLRENFSINTLELNWDGDKVIEDPVNEPFSKTALFILSLYKKSNPKIFSSIKDDPLAFAFDQLEEFEEEFGNYLSNELEKFKDDEYGRFAQRLVNNLGDQHPYSLLNFNYTKFTHEDPMLRKERHIHGSIEDHPIIGIDQGDTDPGDRRYVFTKTYRIMTASVAPKSDKDTILYKSIDEIDFFGHSLNAADFSYFYSIFDYLGIYEKTINLNFYYWIYDLAKRSQIQKQIFNSVLSLIGAYSNKKYGEGRGHNLIHKLLLGTV